jgi:C-3',4' desaturase CrtD
MSVEQASASYDCVVIGAGVSGLTAAALLARAGARILVLERHSVPGGCASFYQREGFRFDVGATRVSGFGARGAHRSVFEYLGAELGAVPVEPVMAVHLPDEIVVRYGDARWRSERIRAFGSSAEPFWAAQERVADLAWDLSAGFPALPVDVASVAGLAGSLRARVLPLALALGRTVASLFPAEPGPRLRAFVDAQLLITAQTDAAHADLTYGATALDLAREGTFHLEDGTAAISIELARSVRRSGGAIAYNSAAASIESKRGRVTAVVTVDGRRIPCAAAIGALPVQNLLALCPALRHGAGAAERYRRKIAALPQRWSAFMLYAGLPPGAVPEETALHHQVLRRYDAPLGEGNTAFLSLSAPGDVRRARGGGRAVTISTHSESARWERAAQAGTLPALEREYAERMLAALDTVVPGASRRATLVEAATPLTFARYTSRFRGFVGGVPQTPATSNLAALSHRTPLGGLLLCGDTAFPGQSTVGATLSGITAARSLCPELAVSFCRQARKNGR